MSRPGGDEAGGILVKHRHQLPNPGVLLPHWLLRASPLHPEAYEGRKIVKVGILWNDIVGLRL